MYYALAQLICDGQKDGRSCRQAYPVGAVEVALYSRIDLRQMARQRGWSRDGKEHKDYCPACSDVRDAAKKAGE